MIKCSLAENIKFIEIKALVTTVTELLIADTLLEVNSLAHRLQHIKCYISSFYILQ